MSGVDPNRLINLALALAQHHTDETDELAETSVRPCQVGPSMTPIFCGPLLK
jgi:hypothetical protein